MIADNTKKPGRRSVETGTRETKKGTNLSLSEDSLQMAEALKAAMNRPSKTNLVEALIHAAYDELTPKQKEEAERKMKVNGNGVHSIAA